MVRIALIVAALLALLYAMPAAGNAPHEYGREKVAQLSVPVDAVMGSRAEGSTPSARAALADLALWTGPLQNVGVGRNPYTMVVTLTGTARAAGDVRTRWQGGWEVRESPVATREVRMRTAGHLANAAAAGMPITLTLVSGPVSFRGERQVSPQLHQVAASNLDVHDVQLQVWSGPAPIGLATLSVQRPALLAVALLCAVGCWLLRRRAPAPPRLRDALDTRPPVVGRPQAEAANSVLPPAAPCEAAPAIDALLEHHWPQEQRVHATPPTSTVTTGAPAPVRASATSSVIAALHDVLRVGLVVPAEADSARRPRRRPPRSAAQG